MLSIFELKLAVFLFSHKIKHKHNDKKDNSHLSTSSAVSSLLVFPALQVKTLLILMTTINVYNPLQQKSAFPVDLRSYSWKEKSLNKTRLGKSLIIV
jgi:hypothetical protein